MRDFGSWFAEQGKEESEQVDGTIWLNCRSCGKYELGDLAAYRNGDTGCYIEEEVEPDNAYDGVCGGSQFCTP